MSKVVSLKAIKYEKQYKDFYNNVNYRSLSLNCFFSKKDTVDKKTQIS